MKAKLKTIALILCGSLLLSGCGVENTDGKAENKTDISGGDGQMFTDNDYRTDFDEDGSVKITLKGDSAEATSETVSINGGNITITEEATYIISGELSGSITVNAPSEAKPRLILNGVNITSAESACILVLECDKLFITLAEGTENLLTCGESFTATEEANVDGAVFSKQDISINGKGSLEISSPGGNGIVSKDDLVITGGNYKITAAGHGLDANDSVRISDSNLEVSSGKDGIHAENTDDSSLGFIYFSSGELTVNAGGDGIDAGSYIQIESGSFDITSNKSSSSDVSTKGIKAEGELLVNGGRFIISSPDDALHSNSSIYINGGSFEISTDDDGVHADETLSITAGEINITDSYEGLEALHVDISGGNIKLRADDDGINAAGGTDSSGFGGGFTPDGFGGNHGGMRPGGRAMPGGSSSASSGSITISGGVIYIIAYGDGLDANGTLEISGGHTTVSGPTTGDTATLDFDVSGVITGGTFIGTGASNMAQVFSDSSQGVFAVRTSTMSAGTEIVLTDSEGNVVISFTPELNFQVIILSSPSIKKGETYTVTVGSISGEAAAS